MDLSITLPLATQLSLGVDASVIYALCAFGTVWTLVASLDTYLWRVRR